MRAARIYGNKDVRVDDVPIPTLEDPMNGAGGTAESNVDADAASGLVAPVDAGVGVGKNEDSGGKGRDEWKTAPRAIVEVEWCGICGSDLS